MPNVGDELHHFGWNACSSRAVPVGRRTRTSSAATCSCPGLRSSRIHIVDVKDDPRDAEARQGHRGRRARDARPATRARTRSTAAPTASTSRALGAPDGDGPGGVFLLDHDDFSIKGAWEVDRGPQELAYDFWWHLGYDTLLTSEWGTPNMVENGVEPELLLGNKYGHQLHVWDLRKRTPPAGDRPRRRAPDGARAAPGARPAQGRTASSASSSRPPTCRASVWLWHRDDDGTVERREGHHDPGRAGRGRAAAAGAAAVRRRAAAGHRHHADRSTTRTLLRLLLGHRRAQALRRLRPAQPARDRLGAPRRHRRARAAPGRGPLNGGPQMVEVSRDGKRVYLTNSLYAALGRAVLPRGDRRLDGQARRRRGRLADARPGLLRRRSTASARTRCASPAATPRRTRTASPT